VRRNSAGPGAGCYPSIPIPLQEAEPIAPAISMLPRGNRNCSDIARRQAQERPRCHAGLLYVQSGVTPCARRSALALMIMSSRSYCKQGEAKYQPSILGDPPLLRVIVRRGTPYVDQVLRGAKPADLPVQVPVKFEMAINAKSAAAFRCFADCPQIPERRFSPRWSVEEGETRRKSLHQSGR